MGTKGRRLCAQPFRSCSSRRVVEVPLARPDAPATMQGDAAGAQARPVLFGNAAWKRAAESRLFFFSVAAFFTGSEVPRGRATTMPQVHRLTGGQVQRGSSALAPGDGGSGLIGSERHSRTNT